MSWLSEDPRIPVAVLGLVAVVFLLAMYVTQQGKYLIRAGVALAAAALILAIEQVWVTDAERIEWVVYDLADAVQSRDVDRVLGHFTAKPQLVVRGISLGEPMAPERIRSALEQTQFDMVRVRKLTTNAGEQSRRGSAEFQVLSSGSVETEGPTLNFATADTSWSLGFVEVEGAWKVNRVTPGRMPRGSESYIFRMLGR